MAISRITTTPEISIFAGKKCRDCGGGMSLRRKGGFGYKCVECGGKHYRTKKLRIPYSGTMTVVRNFGG